MPRISMFFGIVISMNWDDHWPPHFHVRDADFKASISIDTLEMLRGRLPRRRLALVREWAELHVDELLVNWELARRKQPLNSIEPLT